MRTVLETGHSIDDLFEGLVGTFAVGEFKQKYKKDAQAKSEKAGQAHGCSVHAFVVTDQKTATALYYREFPLPW